MCVCVCMFVCVCACACALRARGASEHEWLPRCRCQTNEKRFASRQPVTPGGMPVTHQDASRGDRHHIWHAFRTDKSVRARKAAQVNAACNKNTIPLHLSLQFGHPEVARALVDAGYAFSFPAHPFASLSVVLQTHGGQFSMCVARVCAVRILLCHAVASLSVCQSASFLNIFLDRNTLCAEPISTTWMTMACRPAT